VHPPIITQNIILLVTMKLSIVNILVVFGFKLLANNVAADEPETCVDKKIGGTKIEYTKGTVVDGVTTFADPFGKMLRTDKKCKHLAKESPKTIANACVFGKLNIEGDLVLGGVADYCKLTCGTCVIAACADNYDAIFPIEGSLNKKKGCRWLRKNQEKNLYYKSLMCEEGKGGYLHCKQTCGLCGTCVDNKIRGVKIEYSKGKRVNGVTVFTDPSKLRTNRKCKNLAKESSKTIANACEFGKLNIEGDLVLGGIADYCKKTCDTCGD